MKRGRGRKRDRLPPTVCLVCRVGYCELCVGQGRDVNGRTFVVRCDCPECGGADA